jgi:putative transposase
MPRLSRVVFPGVPHHITQRGNRQEDVFFTDDNRNIYLSWLKEYSDRHKVDVIAYCLMTNHVHLVAVPQDEGGLERVLRPLHMRYAQLLNKERGWKGHLWQGRYFSSPLDEDYLWSAIRYVESNPVRARMVREAEDYRCSSASGHCGLIKDRVLTNKSDWWVKFEVIGDWRSWLSEEEDINRAETIRRNTYKGLPTGSEEFVKSLEIVTRRILQFRPVGRPKKVEK